MKLTAFGLAVLVTTASASGVLAQERPDFSGAWSGPAPGPPAQSGGPQASLGNGWGDTFTIIHHSDTLTVERVLYRPRDYQPTLKFRYALDGSESRNTILRGRGMQVQTSTATWENDKLVITLLYDVSDVRESQAITCEVTQTLWLEPPRQAVGEASLVIETNRCGILDGLPSTTRTVYTKR